MMHFSKVLESYRVAVGVEAKDKTSALEVAARLLCSGDDALDLNNVIAAIDDRERLASTGIGGGIAIPHALLDGVKGTRMAVIRLATPVAFDAKDGIAVDLIFMIAGSRKDTSSHLRLLSKLARMLHDPELRNAARAAPGGQELTRLILDKG